MSQLLTRSEVEIAPGSVYLSLAKLLRQPIVDVHGYVSMETGEPTFKISYLVLADGTHVDVEGEHDFPYVCEFRRYPQPGLSTEQLESLYDEER